MRVFARIIALAAGFTSGGALHLLLMSDAAMLRLQQHGIDTFAWCCKSPGETITIYMVFYSLGCSTTFFAALVLPVSALVERRTSGAALGTRWRFADILPPCAWALLGAALAAGLNLLVVEHDYRDAAAWGEWFAAGTIAVGLPAMRDFTLRYVGAVAALLALVACVAIVARRWSRPLAVGRR